MNLHYLEEIDSTNKYAKEHIKELSDKTVVYTYNQTNGRGRLNRKWSNLGEDNIYASIVLKPSGQMQEVYSNLTQYLCVILAQTFEEYGVILVNDSVEGTAFVVDALFHPALKHADKFKKNFRNFSRRSK